MEGIAVSEFRHFLEESTQNRFTGDLLQCKQYSVLRAGWVP